MYFVISALKLLYGSYGEHRACKDGKMLAWLSVLSNVQMIAYGPAWATATLSPLA